MKKEIISKIVCKTKNYIFILSQQLIVAKPLWTFDTLFVSEEEGLVRNIDYSKLQSSSEELLSVEEEKIPTSKKSNGITCVIGASLPPRAIENSYEVFAKILVRDSKEATKQKMREVKASVTNKEISFGHFYIMLKTFNEVIVRREGETMHKALKVIVHQAYEDNENLFEDGVWFEKIINDILCLVLNAQAEKNVVDTVVEKYSMLEVISTHFDLFKKFWLDYRAAKRAKLEQDRMNKETICVIDVQNVPKNASEITFRVFSEILIRDSQEIIENRLQELKPYNDEKAALNSILEKIQILKNANVKRRGEEMFETLREIDSNNDDDYSPWLRRVIDRIFCQALKLHTTSDVNNLIANSTIKTVIKEHFKIFKQFWLEYPIAKTTKLPNI